MSAAAQTIASAPSGKNGVVAYSLDPVGNRLADTSSLSGISSTSATFDADDRLSTETYDGNGNTLTSGGKTFTYDSENHLITMNGGAVTLTYDGDGNRVAKTVGGVTTRYLVDDLNPTGYAQVVEEVVSGAVQRQYTYGLQRISQNQIISSAWTPSFYQYDGAGSVRQLTNTGGTITDSYEYDAFGNEFTVSGGSNTPNEMMYRGEQYDSDLGLYYLRARYYNPLTGRFLSRDPENGIPTDPKTLHKYMYAGGDPVNRIDPRGRADEEEYEINISGNQEKEAPVEEETGNEYACFTLWLADRAWCSTAGSLDEYGLCNGVADLNYWRCLNHQPRIPLPGLPLE